MKITDIQGSTSALPRKMEYTYTDLEGDKHRIGHNSAIDLLEQVLVEVDVEELAKEISNIRLNVKDVPKLITGDYSGEYPSKSLSNFISKSLSLSAHKWLRLKKG